MLILRAYEPTVLPPVPKWDWRTRSAAQPKDQFGNENTTRFRLRARRRFDDGLGSVVWQGWFDDRDDADAFLHSLSRHLAFDEPMPRGDWQLPTPMWAPDLGENLEYEFATVVFLSTGAGTGNQTYTRPADWNNANNSVETIGAGGSGAAVGSVVGSGVRVAAGSGGAWNKQTNITLGATATYNIGAGGALVSTATGTPVSGNNGNDVWFNGTTLGGSSVGSKAGLGGAQNNSTTAITGALGGVGSSGVGSSSNNGGAGGGNSARFGAPGGGGAAGLNGAGNSGVNTTVTGTGSAGGSGDAGSGGSAGAIAGNGGNGTEYDASHGSGGGSGGTSSASSATAGVPGTYGAASGAASCQSGGTATTPAGAQSLIVITYTPSVGSASLAWDCFDVPRPSRRVIPYDAKIAA